MTGTPQPPQVLAGQQGGLANAQGAVTPPPDQGTPQPPTVTPPQAAPAPTLGAVAQQAQEEPDIDAKFQKYLALTQAAQAANMREHLPESSRPGILANIVTFGMAGAMHHDYEAAYNAAVDKQNAELGSKAVQNAVDLVGKDVGLSHGDINQQIGLLRLQQSIDAARLTNLYRQNRLALSATGLDLQGQGLDLQRQRFGFQQTYPAPTEEQRAAAGDMGYGYMPAPGFNNRFMLVPLNRKGDVPGGTPGDPTAQGGAGGTPNHPGNEPAASGTPGGPLTSAGLRQQKAEAAGTAQLAKDRATTLEEVRRNADSVRAYLEDPAFEKAITTVLPSGTGSPLVAGAKRLANPAGAFLKGMSGDENVAYLQRAESNIIEAIRSLSAGSKGMRINIPEIEIFGKQWQQLAKGGMTQEEARTFKHLFLKRLDQVQGVLSRTPAAVTSGTSTTTTPSTTTTSTTLGAAGASRRPATASEFLRKHGVE